MRLSIGILLIVAGCSSAPTGPIPAPLPEALAWERVESGRAFLGVDGEEHLASSLEELSFAPGVRVKGVAENSPAALAGLRTGDVVIAFDGREVDEPAGLAALVERAGPGAEVTLEVQRDDTLFDVKLALAGRGSGATLAEVEVAARIDPSRSRAAWVTTPDGVRLVARADDSPPGRAGLPVGTLVEALDGEALLSARQLLRRLAAHEPGADVVLSVRLPDGTRREVTVELFEPDTRVIETSLPVLYAYTAEADGSRASLSLLDLWFFQLFQYQRDGAEQRWVLLELFGFDLIPFASGLGELQ